MATTTQLLRAAAPRQRDDATIAPCFGVPLRRSSSSSSSSGAGGAPCPPSGRATAGECLRCAGPRRSSRHRMRRAHRGMHCNEGGGEEKRPFSELSKNFGLYFHFHTISTPLLHQSFVTKCSMVQHELGRGHFQMVPTFTFTPLLHHEGRRCRTKKEHRKPGFPPSNEINLYR
jgi:hypothetical protein